MRVFKETAHSSSMLITGEGYTQITAGPMSVTVEREKGVFLSGPVAISSGVGSVKFGGLFKINPLVMTGLPSTMVTPIPTMLLDPPISNLASMAAIAVALAGIPAVFS